MKEMTKKEKFKKFISDNRETIAKVTVYTTLVVGSIAIIAKAISNDQESQRKFAEDIEEYNSWVDGENEWLNEKNEDNYVYALHDLTYLLVPKDAKPEWVNDRPTTPYPKKK
jgi:hypothetical protein